MFVIRRRITFLLKIIAIHFYLVSNKKLESSDKQNWICCCSSNRFWWFFFQNLISPERTFRILKKAIFLSREYLWSQKNLKSLVEIHLWLIVLPCQLLSANLHELRWQLLNPGRWPTSTGQPSWMRSRWGTGTLTSNMHSGITVSQLRR